MSNQIAAIPPLRAGVCNGSEMPPLLAAALFDNKTRLPSLQGDAPAPPFLLFVSFSTTTQFSFSFLSFFSYSLIFWEGCWREGWLEATSTPRAVRAPPPPPITTTTTKHQHPPPLLLLPPSAQQRVWSSSTFFFLWRMKNPARVDDMTGGGASFSSRGGGGGSGGASLRAGVVRHESFCGLGLLCVHECGKPLPQKAFVEDVNVAPTSVFWRSEMFGRVEGEVGGSEGMNGAVVGGGGGARV